MGIFRRTAEPVPDGVHELDHRALVDLRRAGADLGRPRHFRRYLVVADRAAGELLAEDCRGLVSGVVSVDREREDGIVGDWVVRVESTERLDLDRVSSERWLLERLAERHGARYGGWEGAIEPKRTP